MNSLEQVNKLEYGEFPYHWKKSTVIPIEKKTIRNKSEEFGLINMVPVHEKLLEVVNNEFIKYLEETKLLNDYQAGFRKTNSCESALQTVRMNRKIPLNGWGSGFSKLLVDACS